MRHHIYVISGSMTVRMDDGEERTVNAGDLVDVGPGHDAWVEGDEPCVSIDMSPDALRYAMSRPEGIAEPEDQYMSWYGGYQAFNTGTRTR